MNGRNDDLKRRVSRKDDDLSCFWCSKSEEGRGDLNRTVKSGHSPPGKEKRGKLFLSINRTDATQETEEMAVETSTRQLSPDTVSIAQSGWKEVFRTTGLGAAFIGYAVKLALLSQEKVNMF